LLYSSRADVRLAPAYDMLTTRVYAGFQHNPPGIGFMGKKTWAPGKNLLKFIAANFGIQPKEQLAIVESISDAVADVAVAVREAMKLHEGFDDIGKRMLPAWAEGVRGLRDERTYSAPGWRPGIRRSVQAPKAQARDEQDRSIALARQEVADACRRPISQCGGAKYQNCNQKSS
jgi:serine/threonine-protein kinase HipA